MMDLRVGVTHPTLPALDNDNGLPLAQNAQAHGLLDTPGDSSVDILLPVDLGEIWLGLVEQEWVDTTVQVSVSRSGRVAGNHEDRGDWAVLGEETSRVTGGGEDEDGTGIHVEGSTDSGHGNGLNDGDGALDQVAHLLEVGDVGDGVLGLETGLVHLANSLVGVGPLGSLARQHDTVGTVRDRVPNIRDLGTGGAGVIDHGLEHLGGTDDGLSSHVAHGDHLLLGGEDLGSRDLNTQVSTGDHDPVGLLENLGEVVETLTVLDLGNDLEVSTLLAKNLADGGDILTTADERGEDHVNVVLDTELEIGLVLLRQGREIDIRVWEVDTLLGGDLPVVASTANDGLLVLDLDNIESEDSVIDVDDTANLDNLCDVLVVDIPR
jgi:hypothetical protein